MSESVGDVKRLAIRAEVEIARIGALQFSVSRGNLSDLGKPWTRVNTKSAHFVLVAISHIKPGAGGIEPHLFSLRPD